MRSASASSDSPAAVERRMTLFRERCASLGLAVTHQRLVIYRALARSLSHPTPEQVYEEVRMEIPSLSFGTVYKNIKTFSEAGLLREVNVLHESLRLDANLERHHHMVCTRCKAVVDAPEACAGPLRVRRLPGGFRPQRVNVEILGLCAACAEGKT